MNWLTFSVLAVLAVTCQTAVAGRLELLGARPDWLLVVVVFLALHAPTRDAVIGAWLLGGLADLMTLERLGFVSLSYGLAALIIVSLREYLFRNRRVTQVIVTLVACAAIRTAWMVYRRWTYDSVPSLLHDAAAEVVWVSVYTALWSVPLHGGLRHTRGLLGLPRPRYSYAGLEHVGGGHV